MLEELPDVVSGGVPARRDERKVVACLNPAYGMLDAATAAYVYEKAVQRGFGIDLTP